MRVFVRNYVCVVHEMYNMHVLLNFSGEIEEPESEIGEVESWSSSTFDPHLQKTETIQINIKRFWEISLLFHKTNSLKFSDIPRSFLV